MADKATVYVIEDDDAVRDSIHLLIESAGLTPRSYASAASFLRAVPFPSNSCCLLTDQNMPDMTGLELLQHLRGLGIAVPAIVMTAGTDCPIGSTAERFGALLLEKPFRPRLLLDLIETALGQ